MITVNQEFEKRVLEIEQYFILLNGIIEKDAKLFFPYNATHKYKNINSELEKVLKANSFLLLYNLIESAIRSSLIVIYDNITAKTVPYNDVINEIKKIWIKEKYANFKKLGENNIFNVMEEIGNDIIELDFVSNNKISGNIDRLFIEGFATKIGFSMRVHYTAGSGEKLHLVKQRRNSLAHGNISFSECGRDFTLEDLTAIKNEVVRYLRQILKNIEKYIEDEKFLK